MPFTPADLGLDGLPASRHDPSTLSNWEAVRLQHLEFLRLSVDFNSHALTGDVVLQMKPLEDGVSEVILDTAGGLKVQTVEVNGTPAQWSMGEPVEPFGTPLNIDVSGVDVNEDGNWDVRVGYETSPEASALQWLEPEQTKDKEAPFLFAQCQVGVHAS